MKEHSKTPIKKIKEKLKIKICPASEGFWVLINCCEESIESYLEEKLELDKEKDSELIMKLSNQATVEDLVEIISIKENEPENAYKKQIEEKFNQKINCLISATQETNT